MTLATNKTENQQLGTPEMYKIETGSTIDRYTSWPSDVTFLGSTYEAKPIKRSNLSHDLEFGSVAVNITALLSNTFKQYVGNQPIEPTRITIYRALSSDLTDYIVVFTGNVKHVTISGQQVQARCESKSDYLTKRIPQIIYQSYCNNDLFDARCGLNAAAYKVTGTVSSVSGNTLVSSAWNNGNGYPDQWFKGGRAVFGTDMRLIVDHTDDTLTLQIPFGSDVIAGVNVDAYPGCDGSPATCKNKFNNLLNHLGMSYIPSRNPVLWGFK
jgi:uncharacterized phage protein (TIGR02218 family)